MVKAKIITDANNNYFTNNKIVTGANIPTSGTYKVGDIIVSTSPNSSSYGWVCTTSGTPGSWKTLQSAADLPDMTWGNIANKPSTFQPTIGTTTTTAFRGDQGQIAYNHSQSAHAPTNAQRNADITKAEMEAKLTGNITTHSHNKYATASHGNHIPSIESPNNAKFLRNDNSWQTISPEDIGGFSQIKLPPHSGSDSDYVKIAEVNLTSSGNEHCELIIAGQGNFGLTGHSTLLIRISGRDSGNVSFNYMVEDDSRDLRVGFVRRTNVIEAWIKRGPFDGIGGITILNKSTGSTVIGNPISQLNEPSGFTEVATRGLYDMKRSMVIPNNISFNGADTNASAISLFSIDPTNNINIGLNNQCYIEVYNSLKCYRDVWTTSQLNLKALRVNSTGFASIGFGANHVRLEYYPDGGYVCIAGSESEFYGFGTGFRSQTFQTTESYTTFGDRMLHITPNRPTWGDAGTVWFRNS